MRKSLYITLTSVALVLVSAASYALASSQTVSASATSTIRACKNDRTGALSMKARCPKGYSSVVWNVRGPAGPAGAPGANGANGAPGATGANGADGAAATVSVGSTGTGAPGSSASVTNVGTSSAAKLNFTVPQGAAGATGAAGSPGAAGTTPWSTPTIMNSGYDATSGSVRACPYTASTSSSTGSPATALDFNGSTYVYTGTTCKTAYPSENTADDTNTPDVDPSDWTEVAAAGQNGTADAWAFIDPGVCASGGSCSSNPVIAHGGPAGSGASLSYLTVGQYRLDVTGCPAADTPGSGQPFPLAVTVTPEGAYPGESSNDSSVINVVDSVRDTTSLGVLGGLGTAQFYLDLGTPSTTTIGQTNGVDEPFAVMINC